MGTIRWRHIDLDSSSPAVAPLSTSSASLSRAHAVGRCPCCEGSGLVPVVDEKLFVARRTASPLDEGFLTPEALGVLKGVRRNTLLPFFKRMIAEGLWLQGRSFSRLGPEERAILMHGYWSRPSHGSFLKTSRHKPEDVSSWLRVGWLDSRDPRAIRKKQERTVAQAAGNHDEVGAMSTMSGHWTTTAQPRVSTPDNVRCSSGFVKEPSRNLPMRSRRWSLRAKEAIT